MCADSQREKFVWLKKLSQLIEKKVPESTVSVMPPDNEELDLPEI